MCTIKQTTFCGDIAFVYRLTARIAELSNPKQISRTGGSIPL